MRMTTSLLLMMFASASLAGAQGPPRDSAGPVVTVTGRVVFADTNGPARFEKVLLKSAVPSSATSDDFFSSLSQAGEDGAENKNAKLSPEEQAQRKQQLAASMKMLSALADLLQATTVAADGTFTFNGVKPGTYYLHAQAKGYIDPLAQFSADDFASLDPAMKKRIAAAATVVIVSASEGAHADLRLERGASISGRVLYDDGSPAVGWTVTTVHDASTAAPDPFADLGLDASDVDVAHLQEASLTDDRGYYRIVGLPTGDYVVKARLATGALGASGTGGGANSMLSMSGLKLTVYSGNTVKRTDAKAVSVKAGEMRSDYDLTMPLSTMHALGGTVRAKSDGHPVSGGRVLLSGELADGKGGPGAPLAAAIHPDGSCRFDYVPGPGTYSLKVTGAVDQQAGATTKVLGQSVTEQKVTHRYGPGAVEARLGDGDVTDVKIDVPEAK